MMAFAMPEGPRVTAGTSQQYAVVGKCCRAERLLLLLFDFAAKQVANRFRLDEMQPVTLGFCLLVTRFVLRALYASCRLR